MRLERCDVAIVGGGPVGLLSGTLLARAGVDVRVLERDQVPVRHSRAIGIHPPGLACLARAGAAEPLCALGVRVRRAHAVSEERLLGSVTFARLPGPYPFVLCVPQSETERVLAARFAAVASEPVRWGHEVLACARHAGGSVLSVHSPGGSYDLAARFVVGCDGKYSLVRSSVPIGFRGGAYGPRFAMMDVRDETQLGADAAIFLAREGLVESFPLPRGMRRWVVELREARDSIDETELQRSVAARTGLTAPAVTAEMMSTFTAEYYLAARFVDARLALAGDAAHILSPIGGQGMNLGWLDAAALADVLQAALAAPERARALLAAYNEARRAAARAAARRARLYLLLGCARRFSRARNVVIRGLLSEALGGRMASVFTMHGLASAPVA